MKIKKYLKNLNTNLNYIENIENIKGGLNKLKVISITKKYTYLNYLKYFFIKKYKISKNNFKLIYTNLNYLKVLNINYIFINYIYYKVYNYLYFIGVFNNLNNSKTYIKKKYILVNYKFINSNIFLKKNDFLNIKINLKNIKFIKIILTFFKFNIILLNYRYLCFKYLKFLII